MEKKEPLLKSLYDLLSDEQKAKIKKYGEEYPNSAEHYTQVMKDETIPLELGVSNAMNIFGIFRPREDFTLVAFHEIFEESGEWDAQMKRLKIHD